MPAFYKATVASFLDTPSEQISGALSERVIQAFAGDESRQLAAWKKQIDILKSVLRETAAETDLCAQWGILFEYPMLRLQRRLDIVLLAGELILVIEFKVGGNAYLGTDIQQAEDYALDLRDFHEASHDRPIVPLLCATDADTSAIASIPETGVGEIWRCNEMGLGGAFSEIARRQALTADKQIDVESWDTAPYRPVPSIIEAAELLYAGHRVREIAYASSDPENLSDTTDRLIEIIEDAHQNSRHVVAFVTGVPGSGKTLAGLNAVHDPRFRENNREPGAFLSGNTPLVTVLREALARDEAQRTGSTLAAARRSVRAEIQGLMNYLEEYLQQQPNDAPVDHVIVFDEAQRAWDAEYGAQKFDRPKSEPALFLEIMDRQQDWAVIIALVGGGQEINRGERGLSEWGNALGERNAKTATKEWGVYAAPGVLTGSDATAWQRLFKDEHTPSWVRADPKLHLPVSVRSYACLASNQWVNAVLHGSADRAAAIAREAKDFPVFVTRSLERARGWLKEQARGHRRCGLVASSGARRLRAYGLGVSLSANDLSDVANWYLMPRGDVRSSYALEVTANEYTCQGLELDYVGVCWGGDLIRANDDGVWTQRSFRGSRWQMVRDADAKNWIMNKYRVLMTRARLGTVIWVPEGDAEDSTRAIEDLDAIAEFLKTAGAREV
jgi:hypothetical protein